MRASTAQEWLVLGVTVSVVASLCSFYEARRVTLMIPAMCVGDDKKLSDLRQTQDLSIETLRAETGTTRRHVEDAGKEMANLREKVAQVEAASGAQAKFRKETRDRLDRIEQKLAKA